MPLIEKVHARQGWYLRRKVRGTRRPWMARGNAALFYLGFAVDTVIRQARMGILLWQVNRIRRRVVREDKLRAYRDTAITPLAREAEDRLEMMQERVVEAVGSAAG